MAIPSGTNSIPQTNLSNFNPAGAQQMRTLKNSSFPNLRAAGMDAGADSANIGATPSTPQFANTDLSKLGTITTGFGDTTRYEKFHEGVDIANKIGTPIPAYAGGKVIAEDTGKKQGDKGYGNSVIIQDAQGNKWRYSHLYTSYVKIGDVVKPGQVFAQMGNTGSTYSTSGGTGSHLDLRIMNSYNQYVNPNTFFRKTT